jgi:hypothetical protein
MRKFLGAALFAGLLLAGASAHAVRLDLDLDSQSNATWDDATETGTTGNGGAFVETSFDLDATTFDLTTVTVELSFITLDHNFVIHVNGVEVVPIDPGNPAVFSPALAATWTANSNGLPRLTMTFSQTGIEFAGTETSSSPALTTGLVYNQPIVTPGFVAGTNTIRYENPDAAGPDGSQFGLRADAALLILIPEPTTATLFTLGLCGLSLFARGKRA